MSIKDDLVKSMLGNSVAATKTGGPLISEVRSEPLATLNRSMPTQEEPTMLELMMAAQAEAKKEKVAASEFEKKKTTKSFGSGFKKGFFGADTKTTKATPKASSATVASSSTKEESEPMGTNVIPTISKKSSSTNAKGTGLVMEEVQEAMRSDENPLLQQLNKGEWVTPDLVAQMQSNPIIATGLQSRKCSVALQLMQQDPNEAKKRFGDDPEVSLFLREFGKIMGTHFDNLGALQSQQEAPPSVPIAPIQEIGPLHAEAIKKSKEPTSAVSMETPVSDKHVQEVLNDPELREMLMDPQLQAILQECGDPVKFQQHMRNPETAAKIKKLYASGLVGTAN